MLNYPPTDIGGISLQDIQSLSQESLMTDPSMYEKLVYLLLSFDYLLSVHAYLP